jgi:hypothetical protein
LLPAVLFDFICFFLVFFLAAIGAVYHPHMFATKPCQLSRKPLLHLLEEPRSALRENNRVGLVYMRLFGKDVNCDEHLQSTGRQWSFAQNLGLHF